MANFSGLLSVAMIAAKEVTPEKKKFLGSILGVILRKVYDVLEAIIPVEPEHFSFLAMAIIITTIIFKTILLPLSLKQAKSTKMMSDINPKIKELQTKYKNDPQTLANQQRKLYKEMNYNPFTGCLLLLIQFPIILGFFAVFRNPKLYSFAEPGLYESMNKALLWIPDLDMADPFMFGLPLLAGLTTYLQTKIMQKGQLQSPETAGMSNAMMYMAPVMIFLFSMRYAAGLALYWVISNLYTIVQQLIVNRKSIPEEEIAKK